jgi:hypothetical protein
MTILNRSRLGGLLLGATILASPLLVGVPVPAAAQLTIGISVQIAPPILPVYVQPPMPDLGYIWTPGYWRWANAGGYYWVPGTWVRPPTVGVLWTPPYWGWDNGGYVFHEGYWGPHVGFYGGVNYGFGYGGNGYQGGRWNGDRFAYNRTANNFGSVRTTDIYEQRITVINNNRVSYVGGRGGLTFRPRGEERVAERDQHVPLTTEQAAHFAAAANNPALAASRNNGRPPIAATPRAGQFEGPGVVHAAPAVMREHGAAHPVVLHARTDHAAQGNKEKKPGT